MNAREALESGYGSRTYAESLCLGQVIHLPHSDGYLIARQIPESGGSLDLMAPYPVFRCHRWPQLAHDLEELPGSYASVSLVTEPFADITASELARLGWDRFVKMKEHYVVDLARPLEQHISSHHKRKISAVRGLDVEIVEDPSLLLEDWCRLYEHLVARHAIDGIARFSRESFQRQLALPGMVALVAREREDVLGITLWLIDENVAYYHLGAYSEAGYARSASYALFATALEHFRGSVAFLALGGAAGVKPRVSDGLARFKLGWATGVRDVYFCGRIVNRELYAELCARRSTENAGADFFPQYRA